LFYLILGAGLFNHASDNLPYGNNRNKAKRLLRENA